MLNLNTDIAQQYIQSSPISCPSKVLPDQSLARLMSVAISLQSETAFRFKAPSNGPFVILYLYVYHCAISFVAAQVG